MKIKNITLFLLLLFILQACRVSNQYADSAIMCTAEFRQLYVTVQTENGEPIALDSIKLFEGKKDITKIEDFESPEYISMKESGEYLIIDDAMQGILHNKKLDVQFKGYIGKDIITEKTVTVSADQCHVFSLTENLKIVLKSVAHRF